MLGSRPACYTARPFTYRSHAVRVLTPAAAAAALALAGCATTTGTAPTDARSGYDGARVVNIAAHGGACTSMLCPAIGAQWNDKRPDVAIVTVALMNAWQPITGARLMIDGKETRLDPLPGITTFSAPVQGMRESTRDFTAPLATVRALSTAGKAWLRVGTTDGNVEVAIIDGATDSKALHAMRRFLALVDQRPQ